MGKVTKGLALTGLLGAGIAWLLTTKKGKEVREQALDAAADVYERVVGEIKASETYYQLSRNKYLQTVKRVVSDYVAEHNIPENAKAMITKLVAAQWSTLEKEIKKRTSKKSSSAKTKVKKPVRRKKV